MTWRPLRWVDAVAGSVLSMVAVLCAAWALGYSVSGTSIPYLSTASRDSTILERVDGVMPTEASSMCSARSTRCSTPTSSRATSTRSRTRRSRRSRRPTRRPSRAPGVREAAGSVVKILGEASCQRGIEGSGFAYAPDRIMTNAHVVAGCQRPVVVVVGRRACRPRSWCSTPSSMSPCFGSTGSTSHRSTSTPSGKAGDAAAILGFPENGPFDARAARIRSVMDLRSPDIYDRGELVRKTFSIRGLVRSGNSGGPARVGRRRRLRRDLRGLGHRLVDGLRPDRRSGGC